MPTIVVQDKNGATKRHPIAKTEISIGRMHTGNDIVLSAPNVSKRHARLFIENGQMVVEDLQSTCGTYLNGAKLERPLPVRPGDKMYMGDFILEVEPEAEPEAEVAVEPDMEVDEIPGATSARPAVPLPAVAHGPPPPAPPPPAPVQQASAPAPAPVVESTPNRAPIPATAPVMAPPPVQATLTPPPGTSGSSDALHAAIGSLTTAVEALYRIVMDERQKVPMSQRAAAALEETRNALRRYRPG